MPGEREIEGLYAAARAGNTADFRFGVPPLWVAVEDADAAVATAVLDRVMPLFDQVADHATGQLAVLAAAMVERGAPFDELAGVVSRVLARILPAAALFPDAWRRAAGPWARLPDPDETIRAYDDTLARLTSPRRWRRGGGLAVGDALTVADAWFALSAWISPAEQLLRVPGVRSALPGRAGLARQVAALTDARPDLRGLVALLASPPEAPVAPRPRTPNLG